MRRTTVLGAATAAALAAGSLAVTGVLGSSHREAPKILADPTADNTDVYAFTAPDAPHSLTVVANWIPLEEPAGGPYFGKLDPRARYYVKIDNTGDGREDVAYRWQFKQRFRNPESFLDAAPTVDSVDDPDINFVQTYDLYRETYKGKKARARTTDRAQRAGRAGQRRAEDGRRTTPRSQAGAIRGAPGRRQDVRRPVRRSVLRRPRRRVRRHQHRQARPARTSASATRAAARTTSRATTRTRSCCRCRSRRSRVTASRVSDAKAGNAVVGVWATTERRRVSVLRARQAPRLALGPGQPARQPADQRGHHPDRPEGQVQPHVARRRRGELRQVRAQPRARAAAERAVQARREGDEPHGHRPGAADRRPGPDPDRVASGRRPTR